MDMTCRMSRVCIIEHSLFGDRLTDEHGRWKKESESSSVYTPKTEDTLHLGKSGIRIFAMNLKKTVLGKSKSESTTRFNGGRGSYRRALEGNGSRRRSGGSTQNGRTTLPMMATNHDGGEFNIKITKESCKACDQFILTHNRINTCKKCKTIYHAECSKNHFKFNHLTRQWHCLDCITNSVPRYNPFNDLETDRHDQFDMQQLDDAQTISEILNSCKLHDRSSISKTKSTFSVLFNNIDGNASNFDSFFS